MAQGRGMHGPVEQKLPTSSFPIQEFASQGCFTTWLCPSWDSHPPFPNPLLSPVLREFTPCCLVIRGQMMYSLECQSNGRHKEFLAGVMYGQFCALERYCVGKNTFSCHLHGTLPNYL